MSKSVQNLYVTLFSELLFQRSRVEKTLSLNYFKLTWKRSMNFEHLYLYKDNSLVSGP